MSRILTKIDQKYKHGLLRGALPLIVLLVGLSAFGLGRLSVLGEQGPRLIINTPDSTTQVAGVADAKTQYVASKSGSKYYPAGCAAAARIKEENRVYFSTVESARAAGYMLAANCP